MSDHYESQDRTSQVRYLEKLSYLSPKLEEDLYLKCDKFDEKLVATTLRALKGNVSGRVSNALAEFLEKGIFTKPWPPIQHEKRTNPSNNHWTMKKSCKGRGAEAAATGGKQAGQYVGKHALPCKEPKGKHEHNKPSMNISKGNQNAGK